MIRLSHCYSPSAIFAVKNTAPNKSLRCLHILLRRRESIEPKIGRARSAVSRVCEFIRKCGHFNPLDSGTQSINLFLPVQSVTVEGADNRFYSFIRHFKGEGQFFRFLDRLFCCLRRFRFGLHLGHCILKFQRMRRQRLCVLLWSRRFSGHVEISSPSGRPPKLSAGRPTESSVSTKAKVPSGLSKTGGESELKT
jgi:hypothetical protein